MFRYMFSAMVVLCLSMSGAAFAAGSSSDSSSASYQQSGTKKQSYLMKTATKHISDENYKRAFELLKQQVSISPDDADGWNLLGFSARKIGDFDTAKSAYATALTLDPEHTRAMEYMGEMYLSLNQLENAEALLEKLESLCSFNCKDRDMLAAAIKRHKQKNS